MNLLLRGVSAKCQYCKKEYTETVGIQGKGNLEKSLRLKVRNFLSLPQTCKECNHRRGVFNKYRRH